MVFRHSACSASRIPGAAWRLPTRVAGVIAAALASSALALSACAAEQEIDERALPGTAPGVTLEAAVDDFDIEVPSCALNGAAVFRAPPGSGLSPPWLYLRLQVNEECLSEALDDLSIDEADLLEAEFHWVDSVPASGGHPDSSPARLHVTVLAATEVRGELQVKVSVEEFDSSLYLHLIATL
jgi:hypothetical protein